MNYSKYEVSLSGLFMNVKSITTIIVVLILLTGCNKHKYKKMLLQNRTNLMLLKVGMAKEDAMKVMTTNQEQNENSITTNPWKIEACQKNGDIYEIVYYITRR